jgi:hypothetical protein
VKTLDPWVEVLPSGFQRTFCVLFELFRSSRVEVLPVATEVLRTPSQRPSRLLKATVRPVAYCGPRCRVRRDSTVFPVFYDGLAAQCGPSASSLAPPSSRSSRLHGLHDYVRSTRLPASAFLSHRCHVAALGRSCSGRPDVEDVVLPLEPAGSLTFQGYSAQRSPTGDHLKPFLPR